MPALFSNTPGVVAQLQSVGLPMSLRIGNPAKQGLYSIWRGYSTFKAIVTGVSFQQQSGFQILHTLNQFLYIYSFGERAADLVINGLTFMSTCTANGGAAQNLTGFEHVVNFYNTNRLSTTGQPVSIVIGTKIALSGILVGQKSDMMDPNMGIGSFSLMFKCPPI